MAVAEHKRKAAQKKGKMTNGRSCYSEQGQTNGHKAEEESWEPQTHNHTEPEGSVNEWK
jgi:hypothetical protein